MQSLQQKTSHKKRNILIAVAVVCLVLASLATAYYLKRKDDAYKTKQYGSSQTNPNSNTPIADSSNNTGGSSSSKDATEAPAPAADSSIVPSAPVGNFVSNHHPNLSGQPAPNLESSTCSTSPGVQCQIKFTHGDIVKYLDPQVTNADGNTSWTWKVSDIGLTVGDWKITAIATNGSKTATADDAMLLSVKE